LAESFNYAEVGLWSTLGIIAFVIGGRRTGVVRRRFFLAAPVLVAFGVSDWVEARTGNQWWHPWWLLVWKGTCLTILSVLALVSYRDTARSRRAEGQGVTSRS